METLSCLEPIAVLTTTVGSAEAAEHLAQSAVQSGMAACVQVQAITSHYIWQGQQERSAEWRLVLKTVPAVAADLWHWVQAQHPYDVPQLLLRTEHANAAYAAWVAEQINIKK